MDKILYIYHYNTEVGTISLIPEAGNRYKVMFQDEVLGSYHSAMAAADDVSGGHTFSPSNGVEFDKLDIPADIQEWQSRVFAKTDGFRPA